MVFYHIDISNLYQQLQFISMSRKEKDIQKWIIGVIVILGILFAVVYAYNEIQKFTNTTI